MNFLLRTWIEFLVSGQRGCVEGKQGLPTHVGILSQNQYDFHIFRNDKNTCV